MNLQKRLTNIKGDLSGVAKAGSEHPKIAERVSSIGMAEHVFEGCPTLFWDVHGDKGHPVRATVSEMGPVLLSNLLVLNETQEGVLHIAFALADEQGLLLLDLKDLRAMLNWVHFKGYDYKDSSKYVTSQDGDIIEGRLAFYF